MRLSLDSSQGEAVHRRLTWLRSPYEYLVLYGGLLLFAVASLAWSLPAAVLYPLLPPRSGGRLGRAAIATGFRWYLNVLQASGIVRLDLRALDALRDERGLIIAPNHPSLMDVVLVASRLPRVTCIMKAEIWDNILLGGGARLARYIRNDTRVNMIRLAAQRLESGGQLLIFPEGTRTVLPPVNEFKGGFALIAKKAACPVQTVFIDTESPFLGKGWPLLRKPAFPLVYRARLGRRFEVPDDIRNFVAELEAYYRQELAGTAAGAGSGEPDA